MLLLPSAPPDLALGLDALCALQGRAAEVDAIRVAVDRGGAVFPVVVLS